MGYNIIKQFCILIDPPHPTYQSKDSRNRILKFLSDEQKRSPGGYRLNIGSAARRFNREMINLDLFKGDEVDIQGDLLNLPIKDEAIDTIVCTGVL